MPRKPNIDPPVSLELMLPQTVRTRLDLVLYSPLENRVPKGKYQEFFLTLLNDWWESRSLDLSEFGFPPGSVVKATKPVIDALRQRLLETGEKGAS